MECTDVFFYNLWLICTCTYIEYAQQNDQKLKIKIISRIARDQEGHRAEFFTFVTCNKKLLSCPTNSAKI